LVILASQRVDAAADEGVFQATREEGKEGRRGGKRREKGLVRHQATSKKKGLSDDTDFSFRQRRKRGDAPKHGARVSCREKDADLLQEGSGTREGGEERGTPTFHGSPERRKAKLPDSRAEGGGSRERSRGEGVSP